MKPQPIQSGETAEPGAQEAGQSLVVILMLGALLAFFGAVLTRMLIREAAQVVITKQRDKLFTAGDGALQRSVSILLSNDANWNSPESLPGYSSLTVTAYTDIPGMKYYIRIKKGTLSDTGNTGAATDWNIDQWTNTGSLTYDRTIFVRTVSTVTGKEDRFYTTVHRTESNYWYGQDGIITGGNMELGNTWSGDAYNSCLGPYGGSGGGGAAGTDAAAASSLTSGGTISGGSGNFSNFKTNPNSSVGMPAISPPASAVPVPGLAGVGSTLGTSVTLGPATSLAGIDYQCANINLNAKTISVDVSGGPVRLWVTGSVSMGGNSAITPTGSYPGCCAAKGFTLYVTSDDTATYGNSCGNCNGANIAWNGTPVGNWMLVAPKAVFCQSGGGSGQFKGAIAARMVCINAGGSAWFIYDQCLADAPAADNYKAPPLITTTWRQIGLKSQPVP